MSDGTIFLVIACAPAALMLLGQVVIRSWFRWGPGGWATSERQMRAQFRIKR